MSVIKITSENFENEVLNSENPVLIDFWADWCGPCRMLSPIVDEIAEQVDTIKVCKVNVDEEPELAQKFNVISIPYLVVMQNRKITNSSVGVVTKEKILSLF